MEFVQTDLLESIAFDLEKALIAQYGRRDLGLGPLTNLTDGGEGTAGHIFTKERCDKISKSLTGKKLSPEHIEALRNGAKNRIRLPMSEETKDRIRQKAIGRGHTEATRKKLSIAKTGVPLGPPSEETRRKISDAQIGKPKFLLRGQKRTQETCDKISKALTGKVRGPEQKLTMSIAAKNRIRPMTKKTKLKISNALKGKKKAPFSDEHRRNIGNVTRGRVPTEQARLNMKTAQQNRRKNEAA